MGLRWKMDGVKLGVVACGSEDLQNINREFIIWLHLALRQEFFIKDKKIIW